MFAMPVKFEQFILFCDDSYEATNVENFDEIDVVKNLTNFASTYRRNYALMKHII